MKDIRHIPVRKWRRAVKKLGFTLVNGSSHTKVMRNGRHVTAFKTTGMIGPKTMQEQLKHMGVTEAQLLEVL